MRTFRNLDLFTLATLALTSLLVLSAPQASIAQETDNGAAEEFPVGTEPAIQPGQTYARETFGDWELMCVKTAEGPEPCEIGHLIIDDAGNPVSDVRFFPLQDAGQVLAGGTFVTPLGVLLTNGVVYSVDDKTPKQYPFQFCNSIGCVARVGLTALELQAMRKGAVGHLVITMVNNPGQPVNIPVSLKGFAAAYAALSKLILEQQ